jgi:O-antigen ligase
MKIKFVEFIFALFLLSGQVKSFQLYFKVPMPLDFTLLMTALLMVIFIGSIVLKGPNPKIHNKQVLPAIWLGLMMAWSAITLTYSASTVYSYEKIMFLLLCGICYAFPIVYRGLDMVGVLRSFALIIFPMAIIFVHQLYTKYISSYDESFKNFQVNYLALSELLGFILVCFIERGFLLPRPSWRLPLLMVGIATMLLLGARGPLMILIICVGIRVGSNIVRGKFSVTPKAVVRAVALSFFSAILMGALYIASPEVIEGLVERTLFRFGSLGSELGQEESVGSETMSRTDLIDRALEFTFQNATTTAFGHGIGSFGVLYLEVDQRAYPHNIFLEMWVETGLVGLVLLIGFLVSCFRSADKNAAITQLVLMYWIMNSLKSHTIIDLKVLFAALAMISIGVPYTLQKYKKRTVSAARY